MRRLILVLMSFLLVIAIGCSAAKNTGGDQAATKTGAVQKDVEAPLAEGFPKDFPLIDGIVTTSMKNTVTEAEEGNAVGDGYYTQIKTDKTVEKAMSFYKPKFTKIVKQEPAKKGMAAMYSGFINKYAATIYFTEQKSKTMITIVLSAGKK